MPRANKVMMVTVEEDKVFYWPDTGPIQYTVSGGRIIKAQMVDEQKQAWCCRTDEEEHQRVREILDNLTHEAENLGLYDERSEDLHS